MFQDELLVRKGFLISAGVLLFSRQKTPETNELMTIASGQVNMILFTWYMYLLPSVHSLADVIPFILAHLIFPSIPKLQ